MAQSLTANRRKYARMFAALGDENRLSLVAKLCKNQPLSIAALTRGSKLTRQAITKHLHILERAGIVESVRVGRSVLYELRADRLAALSRSLNIASHQWDGALERLQLYVE